MTRVAAEAFFADYRDAFNALDGDAVAALYAEPCSISQDGATTLWPTRTAVADNMRRLCDLYRADGYQRADFSVAHVEPMAQSAGFVHLRWRIVRAGKADHVFGTGYTLMRADAWRIVHVTAFEETRTR